MYGGEKVAIVTLRFGTRERFEGGQTYVMRSFGITKMPSRRVGSVSNISSTSQPLVTVPNTQYVHAAESDSSTQAFHLGMIMKAWAVLTWMPRAQNLGSIS